MEREILSEIGTQLAKQYEIEREILISCVKMEVEKLGFKVFHGITGNLHDAILWRACKEYMDTFAMISEEYEPTNPFNVINTLMELELI